MKKINVLQLIASLCLLLWSIIKLLDAIIEIPRALQFFALALALAAAVLYSVVTIREIKAKKKSANDEKR